MLTPDEREWVRQAALKQAAARLPEPPPVEAWMRTTDLQPGVFDFLFLKQLRICAD